MDEASRFEWRGEGENGKLKGFRVRDMAIWRQVEV